MIHAVDFLVVATFVFVQWRITLLLLQQMRNWLLPAVGNAEVDFAILEWTVAGHHPAYDHASPPRTNPPAAGATITILPERRDLVICTAT